MISFVNIHARNLFYSQNGEEGILIACARRFIDNSVFPSEHTRPWGVHCVEIGAHNGRFCSNTALLINSYASGLFVESDWNLYQQCVENYKDNPRVRVQCCHVDGKNINAFVDDSCDVLSVDVDGGDYQIFEGLKAKPKIVIVEIDSSIRPDSDELNADGACGYGPMVRLGIEKGYFLLAHTGNLIFVHNQYRDLFPEILGDGSSNWGSYFKRDWLKNEKPYYV